MTEARAGDKYEGEWHRGREQGTGTSIATDGATFYGFWEAGVMHGEGVRPPALRPACSAPELKPHCEWRLGPGVGCLHAAGEHAPLRCAQRAAHPC